MHNSDDDVHELPSELGRRSPVTRRVEQITRDGQEKRQRCDAGVTAPSAPLTGRAPPPEPTPPAACASCRSPLVLHADLRQYNGRVVCTRSAIYNITIRRDGVQCKCGTPIGRLQPQHPTAGPVPVTLGEQVINLPSPNLLPPLRKQMKSGAMYSGQMNIANTVNALLEASGGGGGGDDSDGDGDDDDGDGGDGALLRRRSHACERAL